MSNEYNADAIEVLNGLEPVQRRPGMYTDTTRPNHLSQEVIDNSVDEALGGYASSIRVVLHSDQSIEVTDDGRGMPVDIHPEEGVSAAEVIMTQLHAGGKFDNNSYKVSGGLHGVGISVVNALSETLSLTIYRNNKVYKIAFTNGVANDRLGIIDENTEKNGINWFIYQFQKLKFEYIIYIGKSQNIADCIKKYNFFKEKIYLDISTPRDLIDLVKKIIQARTCNWFY